MEPNTRDGDILMVDKSNEPKVGKGVIAAINGEMTVKRLSEVDGQMTLTADNPNYFEVKVGDFDMSMIWGAAAKVIHQVKFINFRDEKDTFNYVMSSCLLHTYSNSGKASSRHFDRRVCLLSTQFGFGDNYRFENI